MQKDDAPMRSDTQELKDLLNLKMKMKEREIEKAANGRKRRAEKEKSTSLQHVKGEEELKAEVEARKAKQQPKVYQTTRQKIPVHVSSTSGLLEIR